MHRYVSTLTAITLLASPQSAFALDECLLGVWEADLYDLTEMLRQSDVQGEVTVLGGSITLEIAADATLTALTEDVAFKMMIAGTESLMMMKGSNAGRIEAEDAAFVVVIDQFDLATELIINGESMAIPAKPPGSPPEESVGTYNCSLSEMMLTGADQGLGLQAMPRRWTRLR